MKVEPFTWLPNCLVFFISHALLFILPVLISAVLWFMLEGQSYSHPHLYSQKSIFTHFY